MVSGLVLLALLAGSAASGENDAATRIAAIETRIGGRIGVAAFDTSNGKRLDYRADERFAMCSTFKFLAAAAVLKRVDEKKEKLDRFVPYGAKEILEYAPVTKEHLKDGGMTLGALCAAAIEQSDNTAGNLLLNAIGGPAGLTNFVRTLGDRVTRLDRFAGIEQRHSWRRARYNNACGDLFGHAEAVARRRFIRSIAPPARRLVTAQ
jgi:beta-lactamase class A